MSAPEPQRTDKGDRDTNRASRADSDSDEPMDEMPAEQRAALESLFAAADTGNTGFVPYAAVPSLLEAAGFGAFATDDERATAIAFFEAGDILSDGNNAGVGPSGGAGDANIAGAGGSNGSNGSGGSNGSNGSGGVAGGDNNLSREAFVARAPLFLESVLRETLKADTLAGLAGHCAAGTSVAVFRNGTVLLGRPGAAAACEDDEDEAGRLAEDASECLALAVGALGGGGGGADGAAVLGSDAGRGEGCHVVAHRSVSLRAGSPWTAVVTVITDAEIAAAGADPSNVDPADVNGTAADRVLEDAMDGVVIHVAPMP